MPRTQKISERRFEEIRRAGDGGGWLATDVTIIAPDLTRLDTLQPGAYLYFSNAYSDHLFVIDAEYRLVPVEVDDDQ